MYYINTMKNWIVLSKICFGLLYLLVSSLVVHAQDEQVIQQNIYANPAAIGNQQFIQSFRDSKANNNKDKSFYYDDWESVVALANDSTQLRIKKANFHIATSKLVFEKDGQILELFPDKIDHVKFVNEVYKPFPVKIDKKDSKRSEFIEAQFFEVLFDGGDIKLLRNWKVEKMRKTGNHPMGIQTEVGFTYKHKEKLFYIKEDDKYVSKLPRSKKKFAKLFGKQRKEVIEYASKHNLSHKSTNDLKSIFSFYQMSRM